jgi:hypothetical protein
MIEQNAQKIINQIDKVIILTKEDIYDLKHGDFNNIMKRNSEKQILVDNIKNMKKILDSDIITKAQNGANVEIYRSTINDVEKKLNNLNDVNGQLAQILLPLKDMYNSIINDFFKENQSTINVSI